MFLSCLPPIYDELFSRKCSYSPRKHGQYYIFCHAIQQNINKKTTYFCNANLEKIVYKTVA